MRWRGNMKRLNQQLKREIFKSKSRIFSLLMMTLIGVAMYVGIFSITSTMQKSANTYFEKTNVHDISVYGKTPFTEKDLDEIKTSNKELAHVIDVNVVAKSETYASKILTYETLNKPTLVKGRQIKNRNEVLIDSSYTELLNQTITIKNQGLYFEAEVVGIIESPLYFGKFYKGTNTLGIGKTYAYLYTSKETLNQFNIPYNNMVAKFQSLAGLDTFSSHYKEQVKEKGVRIEETFPKATVMTRLDNLSVQAFKEDSSKIREIGGIFPLIFFMVASLVGATIMSRMIEEQRIEIGTFKALGYGKGTITSHYVKYASIPTSLGAALGLLVGFTVLPVVVTKAYSNVYLLPKIVISIDWKIGLTALFIAGITIVGATLGVILTEVKEQPSVLMREKAPMAGKRVFLERISFFWKRLSFINKVSIRNLIRYKKRFFMTVFGIMGCTALLLTGFGLKGSIPPVKDKQFNEIYRFDATVFIKEKVDPTAFKATLDKSKGVENSLKTFQIESDVRAGGIEKTGILLVPEDATKIEDMIALDSALKTREVIMTEKLARLLKVEEGDTFTLTLNHKKYQFKLGAITTHYLGHYIYIDPAYFKEVTGLEVFNSFLVKTNYPQTIDSIATLDGVAMIQDNYEAKNRVGDSMGGLDSVIFVMVGFAGLLVFVVMYSLTTINISERRRELATLKVLGFYNNEVSKYIYKENIALTLIGIGLGLLIGTPLHRYVVTRAEMSDISFIKQLDLKAYIVAFGLTFVFSIFVNIMMRRPIDKIDMIESLKSLE